MKCRWCRQEIEETAQRCHHCRTWQRDGADREDVREAQILDKGIVYWGKFLLALLGAFTAIVVAFFGYDLQQGSKQAWEAERAARTSQADAQGSSRAASDLLRDAKDRVADVDKLLADGRAMLANLEAEVKTHGSQIDQQQVRLEMQGQTIQKQFELLSGQALDVLNADPAKFGDSLKNQGEAISVLQRQIANLQDRLAGLQDSLTEVAIRGPTQQTKEEPLSTDQVAELNRVLAIEQTASKVPDASSSGTRQIYNVNFRTCALANGTCEDRRLDQVVRVVYRFDPRWFSIADVPVSSAINSFSYGIRVWGVTRVRACIIVRGVPNTPIAREGLMSLTGQPTYWGPDPPAASDACTGLGSF